MVLSQLLTVEEKYFLVPKLVRLIRNFSEIFNKKKQKKKFKYLNPLKKAGFSFKEAKQFGFMASKWLWQHLSGGERNLGGRPKLLPIYSYEIKKYFEENCTVAANRFLKLHQKNAFYRHSTLIEAFRKFSPLNNSLDMISFTSFKKYIPKYIKKPHRLSDLCAYCVTNKVN